MSQQFALPGLPVVKAKARTHPFKAESIQKRREAGKFKHITGKAKSSATLKATKKNVFKYIRKAAESFPATSDLSLFYYDVANMVAGPKNLLIPYVKEHAEPGQSLSDVDNDFYYLSKYWLNETFDNFRTVEQMIAQVRAVSPPTTTDQQIHSFVTGTLEFFNQFFLEQDRVAASRPVVSKAALPHEELVQLIAPLTEYKVSESIYKWVSKHAGAKASKPRGARKKSLVDYLVPAGPGIVIFISLTGAALGKTPKLTKKQEAAKPNPGRRVVPFTSRPFMQFNKEEAVSYFLQFLKANVDLLIEALHRAHFTGTAYHVADTDDQATRLQKANSFINELEKEYNAYRVGVRSGATTTNIAYQPAQQAAAVSGATGATGAAQSFATVPPVAGGVTSLFQ